MRKSIYLWNRKEVCITREMGRMDKVCEILSMNDINHLTKTNSITNTGRHHGVPNIDADYAYEYRIYVHRDDYDRAVYLLNQEL